jgi:hypothetical protein
VPPETNRGVRQHIVLGSGDGYCRFQSMVAVRGGGSEVPSDGGGISRPRMSRRCGGTVVQEARSGEECVGLIKVGASGVKRQSRMVYA